MLPLASAGGPCSSLAVRDGPVTSSEPQLLPPPPTLHDNAVDSAHQDSSMSHLDHMEDSSQDSLSQNSDAGEKGMSGAVPMGKESSGKSDSAAPGWDADRLLVRRADWHQREAERRRHKLALMLSPEAAQEESWFASTPLHPHSPPETCSPHSAPDLHARHAHSPVGVSSISAGGYDGGSTLDGLASAGMRRVPLLQLPLSPPSAADTTGAQSPGNAGSSSTRLTSLTDRQRGVRFAEREQLFMLPTVAGPRSHAPHSQSMGRQQPQLFKRSLTSSEISIGTEGHGRLMPGFSSLSDEQRARLRRFERLAASVVANANNSSSGVYSGNGIHGSTTLAVVGSPAGNGAAAEGASIGPHATASIASIMVPNNGSSRRASVTSHVSFTEAAKESVRDMVQQASTTGKGPTSQGAMQGGGHTSGADGHTSPHSSHLLQHNLSRAASGRRNHAGPRRTVSVLQQAFNAMSLNHSYTSNSLESFSARSPPTRSPSGALQEADLERLPALQQKSFRLSRSGSRQLSSSFTNKALLDTTGRVLQVTTSLMSHSNSRRQSAASMAGSESNF